MPHRSAGHQFSSGVNRVRCRTRQLDEEFWSWALQVPAFAADLFSEPAGESWERLAQANRRYAAAVHPEDREIIVMALHARPGESRPFHFLFRLKCKKDAYQVFSIRCEKWQQSADGSLQLSGAAERLDAEQRLENRIYSVEQRYHDLLDGAHELIVLTDLRGCITDLNRAAQRRFGCEIQQILGRNITCVAPNEGDRLGATFTSLLCGAPLPTAEFEFQGAAGLPFPADLDVRAIFDAGRPVGFQLQAWDLTERKRQERSLRVLSGRLLRARDEEQRRLARELHDATSQELAALNLNLKTLQSAPLDAVRQRVLADSVALAKSCLKEVRTIAYLLHPPLLDEVGLSFALKWFCDGFVERSGLRMRLRIDLTLDRLSQEAELALFRIAQEALNNVHHHSGSARAALRLTRRSGDIVLTVADGGKGFPAGGPRMKSGVGLASMRERIRLVGGVLRLRSTPRGTTIQARVPAHSPLKEISHVENSDC